MRTAGAAAGRSAPALAAVLALALGAAPVAAQDAGAPPDAGEAAIVGGDTTATADEATPADEATAAGEALAAEDRPPLPAAERVRVLRAGAAPVPWHQRALSFAGLFVMVALAWAMSSDRKRVPWRIVAWGIGLQLVFGVLVLKTPAGLWFFSLLNDVVARLLQFTDDGARFLFGPYLEREFTVALNVLPTIIFFSSLMSVLYHLGVMQRVVHAVAWVMQRTLNTSGAETLSAAGNIFVGQTEAPLLVRPFVKDMTPSEIMAVMSGGFATVAGGVLAAYVGMLSPYFPDIAGHLIAASVMSAPAALLIAKVMLPETGQPKTAGKLELSAERVHSNVIDAAASGAADGLKLALNVGAMLLAFLALVAMINYLVALPALLHNRATWESLVVALGEAGRAVPDGCASPESAEGYRQCIVRALEAGPVSGEFTAWEPWSLERALGYVFWPIAFVMGTPVDDCSAVATLLGEKLILNEFVAYLHLAGSLEAGADLSHRAVVIATYALCGFSNLGSIAIQIGGIGGIAPERRGDLARLGFRAMIAGTLACLMTACVAGLLV
ncbi:MAG TPA: nucleoside transporter C-terminal domain-containing protein [Sandaracinaceae bacterium]